MKRGLSINEKVAEPDHPLLGAMPCHAPYGDVRLANTLKRRCLALPGIALAFDALGTE
jgi:hypothetical protein